MPSKKDTMSTGDPRTVLCPRCKTPAVYGPDNPHRPFCSERCQLIDLGVWATGGYAIPGDPVEPPPESNDD